IEARHVAGGAVVLAAPLATGRLREAATAIGVAFQAAASEIARPLLGRRPTVRIVAGDAAEPACAGAEATALVHLLDLADEAVLVPARGALEHRPDAMERQPGPEIVVPAVELHDALLAQQVALLADGVAARGLQRGGVDDRLLPLVSGAGTTDMEFAGPVAP